MEPLQAAVGHKRFMPPIVEGARDVVLVPNVLRLNLLLQIENHSILVELHVPSVGGLGVLGRELNLPLLPILSRDRHLLRGSVVDLLHDVLLHVPGAQRARRHQVRPPARRASVRAAEAEGEHAVVGRIALEAHTLGRDDAREANHVQVGIQTTQVAIRRALAVHAHQDTLDEARDSGTSLAMADVRLRGRDDHGIVPGVLGHDLSVGPNLDGVAQRRPGSVALGRVELGGLDATLLDGRIGASLLGRSVGRRQGRTPAILVHLAAGQQAVVTGLAVEILQLDGGGSCSLATRVAVGGGVVGEAAPLV
mmetsp:Transcript_89266/g.288500  ORF Transcript_89266/g.288500 Transcript_89266/m.288500 type:complete len:308 (-) Transcript_89266:1678-2601(-)